MRAPRERASPCLVMKMCPSLCVGHQEGRGAETHHSVFPEMAFEESCFSKGPRGEGWDWRGRTSLPAMKPGLAVAMLEAVTVHAQAALPVPTAVLSADRTYVNLQNPGSTPMKQGSFSPPFYR